MDAQYVNPFVLAIKCVFETMLRTTVKVGKPYVKNDHCAPADVSGVIIGKRHVVSQSQAAPRIVIPCETEHGPVYVEVAMGMEKKSVSRQPAATAGV